MPPRRKKKEPVPPPAAAGHKPLPRFRMRADAGGAERAERCRTRAQGERDQAWADFFGVAPGLDTGANIRSMDSLLGEVLEGLNLQEETLAPEILAQAWLKAVGPALASMSDLLSLVRQTATIRVHHAAARYELNRLKSQLIRCLNEQLGDGSVVRVRLIS